MLINIILKTVIKINFVQTTVTTQLKLNDQSYLLEIEENKNVFSDLDLFEVAGSIVDQNLVSADQITKKWKEFVVIFSNENFLLNPQAKLNYNFYSNIVMPLYINDERNCFKCIFLINMHDILTKCRLVNGYYYTNEICEGILKSEFISRSMQNQILGKLSEIDRFCISEDGTFKISQEHILNLIKSVDFPLYMSFFGFAGNSYELEKELLVKMDKYMFSGYFTICLRGEETIDEMPILKCQTYLRIFKVNNIYYYVALKYPFTWQIENIDSIMKINLGEETSIVFKSNLIQDKKHINDIFVELIDVELVFNPKWRIYLYKIHQHKGLTTEIKTPSPIESINQELKKEKKPPIFLSVEKNKIILMSFVIIFIFTLIISFGYVYTRKNKIEQ